jgi:hypothetical protein
MAASENTLLSGKTAVSVTGALEEQWGTTKGPKYI